MIKNSMVLPGVIRRRSFGIKELQNYHDTDNPSCEISYIDQNRRFWTCQVAKYLDFLAFLLFHICQYPAIQMTSFHEVC